MGLRHASETRLRGFAPVHPLSLSQHHGGDAGGWREKNGRETMSPLTVGSALIKTATETYMTNACNTLFVVLPTTYMIYFCSSLNKLITITKVESDNDPPTFQNKVWSLQKANVTSNTRNITMTK